MLIYHIKMQYKYIETFLKHYFLCALHIKYVIDYLKTKKLHQLFD